MTMYNLWVTLTLFFKVTDEFLMIAFTRWHALEWFAILKAVSDVLDPSGFSIYFLSHYSMWWKFILCLHYARWFPYILFWMSDRNVMLFISWSLTWQWEATFPLSYLKHRWDNLCCYQGESLLLGNQRSLLLPHIPVVLLLEVRSIYALLQKAK